MNKKVGLLLLLYSLVLPVISYLAYHLAPAVGRTTLLAGLAGGALCLAWAVRALIAGKGKALAIVTLVAVNFVMISQVLTAWSRQRESTPNGTTVAGVITLLLVLSLAMLVRLAWSGVVFDVQSPGAAGAPDPSQHKANPKPLAPKTSRS